MPILCIFLKEIIHLKIKKISNYTLIILYNPFTGILVFISYIDDIIMGCTASEHELRSFSNDTNRTHLTLHFTIEYTYTIESTFWIS